MIRSIILVIVNQKFHSRTKHIMMRFHLICEAIEEGVVMKKLRTEENAFDSLIKVVPTQKFKWCNDQFGLHTWP